MELLDDDRFLVRNEKEVAQVLNDLAKHKIMINASFNHGHDTFLTTVISVDDANRAVYMDIGLDENFNARLLASDHIIFSRDGGIRIRWTSSSVKRVKLKDGEAIKISLPKDLIRVQQREFFRMSTPTVRPIVCTIPQYGADGEELDPLELFLIDISAGGIGAYIPGDLPEVLDVGVVLEHCKIDFPELGKTDLTMKVRRVEHEQVREGVFRYHLGLEFDKLSRGNQALIQRYIFNLERNALNT